jgi:site-specific recombinase XerD
MWRHSGQYASGWPVLGAQQLSTNRAQAMNNWEHNVFEGIQTGGDEPGLVQRFLAAHDFSPNTADAFRFDLRKLAGWFVAANHEPFRFERVTVRDLVDLRDHLRRERGQAVATCNRLLISVRRLYRWLVEQGVAATNPAKQVKELRRQALAPKGLDRAQTRRLLREVELRGDARAAAIISLMLYTGARISDVVQLDLDDLLLADRSGHVVFRQGKGNKERTCPLNLAARNAITSYLETRPPLETNRVFVGERGELTAKGVDKLLRKYACLCGFKLHAHLLRHTFAHQFLADNGNDLVALAQLCGHESLNTTMRYTTRGQGQLAESVERVNY